MPLLCPCVPVPCRLSLPRALMRPFTLVFRVSLAAASAAIGRAFSSPRIPASLQIHQKTCQRLSSSSRSTSNSISTSAAWTAASRQHHRPPFAMDATLSREAASFRRGGGFLRGQGARGGRLRCLALGSRSRPEEGSDGHNDGGGVDTRNAAGIGMSALDDELNESQRQAVCAEVGPVRVVAGPGSGKTRVLTRRIAHLVSEMVLLFCSVAGGS